MRYRITTVDGKVLVANDEAHLAEIVQGLKDDVRSIKEYTFKTKKRKNMGVMLRFTKEQKDKYTERALMLGCRTLQDYLKILLLMDQELKIFIPAKKVKRKTEVEITPILKEDLEM